MAKETEMTDYPLDRISYVPVTELLQRIAGSVDSVEMDDIESWIETKCDSSLARVLLYIEREGFRVPVCVMLQPDDDDEFGYEPGSWVMGNGHHRLFAAILLGLDEIPVYFTDSSDYMSSHVTDSKSNVTVTFDEVTDLVADLEKFLGKW